MVSATNNTQFTVVLPLIVMKIRDLTTNIHEKSTKINKNRCLENDLAEPQKADDVLGALMLVLKRKLGLIA